MSDKGNCYDNAPESFIGTLKTECAAGQFATRAQARLAIFEYIEVWYNRQRLHSALGYLSPAAFEQQFRYEKTLSVKTGQGLFFVAAITGKKRAITAARRLSPPMIPSIPPPKRAPRSFSTDQHIKTAQIHLTLGPFLKHQVHVFSPFRLPGFDRGGITPRQPFTSGSQALLS